MKTIAEKLRALPIEVPDPAVVDPEFLEPFCIVPVSLLEKAASVLGQAVRPSGPGCDEPSGHGIELIAAERRRQVTTEGWSPEHDDSHDKGQLAISAARYALEDVGVFPHRAPAARYYALKQLWAWESCWWKPKDPIRNLVRAGALIAAEIDRRLRALPAAPVPRTPEESEK